MVDVAPTTADDLRCAPWTRAQGLDPIGSAGRHDTFLLVETPLPWPEDVAAVPELAEAAGRDPRTRVLAVVPRVVGDGDLRRVVQWRRSATNRFTGRDLVVAADDVVGVLRDLLDDPDGDHPAAVGPSPTDVVVCGHGRRDRCCGRWGTLLQVEADARWTGVRVWRGSHTGGHRYAPTGITFPDGRMWGFLDADVLDAVVTRSGDVTALRDHQRGCTALDRWGQVAERALFEHHGWAWLDHRITSAAVEERDDGGSARVELAWDGPGGPGRATAEVLVARQVPVPVCGSPLEEATKSSPELVLSDLRLSG